MRSTRTLVFALLAIFSASLACDRKQTGSTSTAKSSAPSEVTTDDEPPESATITPPAQPGAMAHSLYRRPHGVGLTWLEPARDQAVDGGTTGMRMMHAVFRDGAWSGPTVVVEGVEFFANWADVPTAVRATDGTLYAHWPQKAEGGTYAYDVVVARSEDDGETWKTLGAPHRDGTPTEHGFATMLPEGEGVRIAWLDGRQMADDPPGPMTLRTTRVAPELEPTKLLDDRVCDCCATDAVATSEGSLVVYRDRDEDEVRDIAVKRRVNGEWRESALVHRDGWTIPGCPVNGPAVAAVEDTVAVAWFTGAGQRARVRVAFSRDAGRTFGTPIELDAKTGDDAPLGRVDVVHLRGREFAVSWLDGDGDEAVIRMQRVSAAGHLGDVIDVAETTRSRASGFPRLQRSGDAVIAAWTVDEKPSRLEASSIPIVAIPQVSRPGEVVSDEEAGPQKGWKLPLFFADGLDGERRRLKTDDRTLVVNIWATWCKPCRQEMPLLDELQRERSDDLKVVAVSVDAAEDEEAVRAWVKETDPDVDVWLDPSNRASRVFGITALPATFVFDPQGRLSWFKRGAVTRGELTQAVAGD